MSDDQDGATGSRKDTRFKKGQTGNPRGRPRKPRYGLTLRQLRKDVLLVMELPLTVKMPDGDRVLTVREASIYSLAKRAIAGEKVAYVKLWLQLQKQAVQEQMVEYPETNGIELHDYILRLGEQIEGIDEKRLKETIRKSKGTL